MLCKNTFSPNFEYYSVHVLNFIFFNPSAIIARISSVGSESSHSGQIIWSPSSVWILIPVFEVARRATQERYFCKSETETTPLSDISRSFEYRVQSFRSFPATMIQPLVLLSRLCAMRYFSSFK